MNEISLKEKVYGHIRQKLGVGFLKAGHRISEVQLAKELGVSRTPVREAIRRLESEGVVRQIPRFGTFVRKLTLLEFQDIWDLRKLLEDYTVSRAATRRSEREVRKMQSIIQSMRKAAHQAKNMTYEEYYEWNDMKQLDVKFHQLIAISAGNSFVVDLREKNAILSSLITTVPVEGLRDHMHHVVRSMKEHYRIFCTIRNRDVEAARYWMDKHMCSSIERIMQSVDPNLPLEERLFGYEGYSIDGINHYNTDS